MLRRNNSVDIFGGERDKVGKNRGGDRWREDGAFVLHPLGKVGQKK